MTDWPAGMTTAPIREWPGAKTRTRKRAPFRRADNTPVPISQTLTALRLELKELYAKDVELLVDIPASKFRQDGRPRADATPNDPGIILSFEIPSVGRVSYPCDTFTTWPDNLRAITLALEALRKVDRYGVAKRGDQYRGYLAIEASAAPAGFSTREDALMFLAGVTGLPYHDHPVATLLRRAQQKTHPDLPGGDAAKFQRVSLAEAKLRAEGLL